MNRRRKGRGVSTARDGNGAGRGRVEHPRTRTRNQILKPAPNPEQRAQRRGTLPRGAVERRAVACEMGEERDRAESGGASRRRLRAAVLRAGEQGA